MTQPIPMVDLKAQYRSIKSEIAEQLARVFNDMAFIQGKFADEFAAAFAAAHGVPHAVGCSSGTTAIELALHALGIGAGDEVITTPFTFFATAEAVVNVGAKPVFVDIDPHTYCIDPQRIEAAITERTRALLPVHLFGNVCDMDALTELAQARDLIVVEDAAQAHLATYRGASVGSFGRMTTFSFYPGKNLGAYGDAGAVLSHTPEDHALLRKLLDHGRSSKYEHEIVGHNFRIDGLQAAFLTAKLRHLDEWTAQRRNRAALYEEHLGGRVKTLTATDGARPVYHLFVIEVRGREALRARLQEDAIASAVHYPIPLHLQPAFASLGHREGDFPVSEAASKRILSLPMYPELTEAQIERIAAHVVDHAGRAIG